MKDSNDEILQEWLTVTEIATALSVNSETVRNWIREGKLPAMIVPTPQSRVRTEFRVRRSDLDAWLESRRVRQRNSPTLM